MGRAFTQDHPEVLKGLQALFNQDNGIGRIEVVSSQGLPNSAQHLAGWLAHIPTDLREQVHFDGTPGFPKTGGSDYSFSCYGMPTFRLGAKEWGYWQYTWHSNRDTPEKIVFDDLESNAKLLEMLAYLASEDPRKITRERIYLTAAIARRRAAVPPGTRIDIPDVWPVCEKAPRKTEPRLK